MSNTDLLETLADDAICYLGCVDSALFDGECDLADSIEGWESTWAELVAAAGSEQAARNEMANIGMPQFNVIVWYRREGWVSTKLDRYTEE